MTFVKVCLSLIIYRVFWANLPAETRFILRNKLK